MNVIGLKLLEWVLPVVLGPLVYYVAREVLNASERLDALPPVAKRVAVVALGTVVSAVFGALKLTAPEACVALTDATVAAGSDALHACAVALSAKVPLQGVTAGLVAMVVHAIKKERPNT
jgi:hypothetical protein